MKRKLRSILAAGFVAPGILIMGLITGHAGCIERDAEGQIAYEGFPFRSHFVELPGGNRIHYLDEGEGPVLMLLHGLPTQAFLWRHMIPTLSRNWRVIAPDLPGFGRSDDMEGICADDHAASIAQFVDALQLEDVTLVIHDAGLVGFLYAANHPEEVAGIAMFETGFAPAPAYAFPPFVTAFRGPEGERLLLQDNVLVEQALFKNADLDVLPLPDMPAFLFRELDERERAVYREPFATPEDRRPLLFPRECLGVVDEPDENLPLFVTMAQYVSTTPTPRLVLFGNPGLVMPADVEVLDPMGDPIIDPSNGLAVTLRRIVTGRVAPELGGWVNTASVSVYDMEAPSLHFWQEESNGAPEELAQAINAWQDSVRSVP